MMEAARLRMTLAGVLGVGVAMSTAFVASLAQPRGARHLGYSSAAWRRQSALEQRFRSGVSSDSISRYHAMVTRRPHMAGSDGARIVAESLSATLKAAGLDVEVLTYRAYLSTPREISVDLIAPVNEALRVTEPASSLDPDTSNPELGPGFVAYSASADVSAPVIYANYGLPADYAQITARGIDVRGKLIIARYGRSHRAVKLYTAQQAGAAGLLIYSDPADDGFTRGETWPKGYWRTSDLLQRGNGKYSWYWHGDPLTPGVPATDDAQRLNPATAPTLPRIPAAVLSWGEARRILEHLDGAVAPAAFQGALPFPYRIGTGTVRVRMHVAMDDGLRTIRDVIARVPGARIADRGVLLGTHHDAWTFGGVDPGTGTAAMLEVARGLGALRRGGWRPERSITLAFWDAEEFGLIGSTEYAEQRQRELRAGTICYINTDLYTNGRLDAGGVPSLRDLLVDVAQDVSAAGGRGTLYDAWRADEWSRASPERRRRECAASRSSSKRSAAAPTSCRFRITSAFPRCRWSSTRPAGTATARITRITTRGFSRSTLRIQASYAARIWCGFSAASRYDSAKRRFYQFVYHTMLIVSRNMSRPHQPGRSTIPARSRCRWTYLLYAGPFGARRNRRARSSATSTRDSPPDY